MLRLFDLGQRIEEQIVENIRDSGVISIASHDKDGNQFRASFFGGHFAGSCDGLLKGVLPPPEQELVLLLEVKSANDKQKNDVLQLMQKDANQKRSVKHRLQQETKQLQKDRLNRKSKKQLVELQFL